MYLKSIELYGFKSFANRTKIEFNDSLTCIVGPNGSGKSNITDAIQWVLGEQSFAALRGETMSDVIFKGTENRRPLGLAEVIIRFDNSSGFLDIDFQTVEVKRKLYKNGDSEYYINNSPCRLKDIRNLFMDTGIGRDGYSIIGQGRIDSILNSKPVERKTIFEEASGISKQKSEKNEIERKLLKTQDNLSRIKDIIAEIKRQRDSLKLQADKAIKYQEIFEKIKKLELELSSVEISDLDKDIDQGQKDYKNYKDLYLSNKSQIEDYESQIKKISPKLDELESKINQYQALNIENIRKEKDIKNSIDLNKEKSKSLENQNIQVELRIKDLDQRKEKDQARLKELEIKKSTNKNSCKSYEKSYKNLDQEYLQISSKLEESSKKLKNLENELSSISILESKLEMVKTSIEDSKYNRDLNLDKTTEKLKSLDKEKENLLLQIDEDKKHIENEKSIFAKNNETIQENLGLSKMLKADYENYNNQLLKIERQINSNQASYQSLKSLEDNYEGYNKSIKNFFSFIRQKDIYIKDLHDTVGNIISVPEKYEQAISNVLGGMTQNLVVESFESAKYIIKLLDENKLGRITFLPIDNLKIYHRQVEIKDQGFIDYASNLVTYDKKFDKVVKYLLGNILVVDNLDNARNISNKYRNKIVSLNGEIIYPGGSVSGGKSRYKSNIFTRKNEIENLESKLKKLNSKAKELSKQTNDLEDKIKETSILEENYLSKKENISGSLRIKENKLYEKNILLESIEEKISELRLELKDYDQDLNKNEDEFTEISKKIQDNSIKKSAINSQIKDLTENIESLNKSKGDLEAEIDQIKTSLTRLSAQDEYLSSQFDDLENNISENKLAKKDLKEKYEENLREIEILKEGKISLEEELYKLQEDIEEFNISYDRIKDERKKVGQKHSDLNNQVKDLRNNNFKAEKSLIQVENDLNNKENKKANIIKTLGENYSLTLLAELCENNLSEEEIDGYKNDLSEYKSKLKKLGNVDLDSINRFRQSNERYEFNCKQYKDMVNSKEKLESVLEEIKDVMEDKFVRSFKTINEKFSRIFTYMFNGGKAELVLVEDQKDEFGIDIIAQLPGKKRQTLGALSGGERSMTAVSLLFAFLETRPSPFCLLDEVDAALDESNIGRFIEYLKKLENIQFALITHRTTTMEAADYIYGVTMEEPGVSKLVSLKF